jgi:hypothetical protein
MQLRFFIDAETGEPHTHSHNVSEVEVAEVIRKPMQDQPGREGSRLALGKTAAGRFLKVVYVPDEIGDGIFVITAYDLQGKALQALRRQMRRRK